jgi:hypothetical protein
MALALALAIAGCAVVTAYAAAEPESECQAGKTPELSSGKVQPQEVLAVAAEGTTDFRPGVIGVVSPSLTPPDVPNVLPEENPSRAPPGCC